MSKQTAGDRLKMFRKLKHLSQMQIAEHLGVRNTTVSQWENNVNGIDVKYIWPICQILEITPSILLGYDQEEIPESLKLSFNEKYLLEVYNSLSQNGKDTLIDIAKSLGDFEKNQTTLVMPIINSGTVPTTELDYYEMAAGMGTGQIVENPIPQKMNIPTRQVPSNADFIIRVVGDSMEPTFSNNDKLFIESTNVLEVGDIGVFNFNGEQLVKEFGNGELISHNKEYSPIKVDKNLYIQGKVLGKV